jgi:hypothetical protein
VVSPTPTHPQDHGNRKRIFAICAALRQQGARVDFVHYPAEQDWRHSRPAHWERQMQAAWDGYQLVPPSRPLHTAATGRDHEIDEWADPGLSHYIAWACRVQSYDLVIVNYTWMSFCLDSVPPGVFKVCDTHDVFSLRRDLLEANGITPEFFHTTPAEEARGLGRAHLVWAIKDSERRYFQTDLGLANCLTMLHAEPEHAWWRAPPSTDGWLRAGVIGARNNVNRRNLEQFLAEALPVFERYMAPVKIIIAGSMTADFQHLRHPNIELLGRVAEVEDFYRGVDLVIAPLRFSTGLKIKVSEALSSGAPLLAHEHAMDGYPTRERLHVLPSFAAMAFELVKLSFDRSDLPRLAECSRVVCATVRHSVLHTLEATRQHLTATFASMVCVVVPMAALDESSLLYDHLFAALDYLRFSAPLALFVMGEPATPSGHLLDTFDQRIRVFADPALMAALGPRAPEGWTAIALHELLELRGYERAYIMADCRAELALGTGRLTRVFIRHDGIEMAGGDADALIEEIRSSTELTVVSGDTHRLMGYRSLYGVAAVEEITFRRYGDFHSLSRAPCPAEYRRALVILGAPDDPIVESLMDLAARLNQQAVVVDVREPPTAHALLGPSPHRNTLNTLGILAEAQLVVAVSYAGSLTGVLLEAAQRRGIPVITLLRGRVASGLYHFASPLLPTTIGRLLQTVAMALADATSHDALIAATRHELEAKITEDAGWTRLWRVLKTPEQKDLDKLDEATALFF